MGGTHVGRALVGSRGRSARGLVEEALADARARFAFPPDVLRKISSRITNEVKGVNRVTYDISSKPPGVRPLVISLFSLANLSVA